MNIREIESHTSLETSPIPIPGMIDQIGTTRSEIVDYFYDITQKITGLLTDDTTLKRRDRASHEAIVGHFFRNETSAIVSLWNEDHGYRERETATLHNILSVLPEYSDIQKKQLISYLTQLHDQWTENESSTLVQEHGSRLQAIYYYMQNELIENEGHLLN